MKHSLSLAACGLSLLGAAAQADDFDAGQYLFGDWGGSRAALHDRGIDLNLGYTFEGAANLSGGQRHSQSHADQTVLGARFDLGKLWGLDGGLFHFTLANRGGEAENLNAKAGIGELMESMEVYGRGRVTRIAEFYYEQRLGEFDLKLGRMNIGAEFGDFECEFTYLGFCGSQPGNFNGTLYNWPISQWAAVARYQLAPDWSLKGGIYQMNPSWLENAQRLNFGNPKGTQGYSLPLELAWTPSLKGLPGSYKLGYWHDSVGGADLFEDQNGQPLALSGEQGRRHGSKDGAYFVFDQQITAAGGDKSRGLSLFAMGTVNDRDITTVDRSLAFGLNYQGPFAARPQDKWGLAAKYLHVSRRLADSQRLQGAPVQGEEMVLASYYKFQLTPYLVLRPEIQYLRHPGGLDENDDAWVAALKGSVSF
ncbi:carbohydrate porin [Gallaecimonas kandeliae]|uniref:carbohydrate porin n=1 Tax=Gallaecimonas kandeliae TaxID=3029055 RepID=UPI002648FBB9|nr:carbohydrate porin [Gallaecimonas kandeliae]WKE65205.1 carbohydrate porin [Gallaecimonas kandeliae]